MRISATVYVPPNLLKDRAARVNAAMRDAISSAGDRIALDARARAPMRTGRLRDSIEKRTVNTATRARGFVGSDVEYAKRVERGFAGRDSLGRLYDTPAHPYLRPALDQNRQAFADELKQRVREALRD